MDRRRASSTAGATAADGHDGAEGIEQQPRLHRVREVRVRCRLGGVLGVEARQLLQRRILGAVEADVGMVVFEPPDVRVVENQLRVKRRSASMP